LNVRPDAKICDLLIASAHGSSWLIVVLLERIVDLLKIMNGGVLA
jgi:hypothetical protein